MLKWRRRMRVGCMPTSSLCVSHGVGHVRHATSDRLDQVDEVRVSEI